MSAALCTRAGCSNTTEHPSLRCFTHRSKKSSSSPPSLPALSSAPLPEDPAEAERVSLVRTIRTSAAILSALPHSPALCSLVEEASYAVVSAPRGNRGFGEALEASMHTLLTPSKARLISSQVRRVLATYGGPAITSFNISFLPGERPVADLVASWTLDGLSTSTPVDLKVLDFASRDSKANDFMALSGLLEATTSSPSLLALAAGQTSLSGIDPAALVVMRNHEDGSVAELYVQSALGAVRQDGRLALTTNSARSQSVTMTRGRTLLQEDADPTALLVSALLPKTDADSLALHLLASARDAAAFEGRSWTRSEQAALARALTSLSPARLVELVLQDAHAAAHPDSLT